MFPSESTITNAVAIPVAENLPPPLLTIPPPQQTTVSSAPSSPELIDILRCNHQRFCFSFTRKLRRYIGCLKPEDSNELEKNTGGCKNDEVIAVVSGCSTSIMQSPDSYSNMNNEERDEKLKSAIVYCKK